MSKPSDFMLGLLDFFAVLLPGVIATWLLQHQLPPALRSAFRLDDGANASSLPWIVYLLTSYALGHFVFMAGSKLDPLYDRWRRRKHPLERDTTYQAARMLRERLTPELKGESFSTFKWSRSYVGIHCPEARLELDRLEAGSKFFRGKVVVSVGLVAHLLFVMQEVPLAVAVVATCMLSFWRYCDQRWKLTELAYATAIIAHGTKLQPAGVNRETTPDDDDA